MTDICESYLLSLSNLACLQLAILFSNVPASWFCDKSVNIVLFKKDGVQVLCASNDAHDQVEPIVPPQDVPLGEKIKFEG